jgi:hypothetical protein
MHRGSKEGGLPEEPERNGLTESPRKEKNDPPAELKNISDSNLQHLFTLAFKIGDWLHTLWNYYFVIVIAIVGWILAKAPAWSQGQKNVFCVVFALASAVNWILIVYNFGFLRKVLRAAEKEFEVGDFFRTVELENYLRSISTRVGWIPFLYFFHAALDLFVIILIQGLAP